MACGFGCARAASRTRPDAIPLVGLDGSAHALSELRGKAVLVEYWASWCKPCRDQLSRYARLQSERAPEGLAVIAVNAGESREAVEGYLHSVPLPFPVFRDVDGSLARSLEIQALPSRVLLDRQGQVRARFTGVDPEAEAQLARELEAVLE